MRWLMNIKCALAFKQNFKRQRQTSDVTRLRIDIQLENTDWLECNPEISLSYTHTHTPDTFTQVSKKKKYWMKAKIKPPWLLILWLSFFLQPFFLLSSASYRAAACSHDAACSFWLLVEECANPEWRAERPHPHETHVQHFILGSNQVANISSLHEHVYTWECTHARMHTETHICVYGWVWKQGQCRAGSFNRWLQGLGRRASMDSKPTTAAKAERNEM